MIDGKFDVVFRGQIVKSFDEATVKANLVKLFKSSPDAIDRLFSGVETPIRKGLDYTAAMKYQAALKNAGALGLIKEVESSEPPTQATPKPAANSTKATFGPVPVKEPPAPALEQAETPAAPQISDPAPQAVPEVEANGEMTLADAGSRILPNKVYEKREVDTSDLSLANAGERILPKKPPEEHPDLNLEHLAITDDTSPIGGEK